MRGLPLLLLHRATGCANVARDESNNVESILAHIPDIASRDRCQDSASPAIIASDAARHRVTKGRSYFLRPRATRPVPKGRERRRAVTADLSAFEPPAERLRRSEGDTGSQRAHSFPYRGECASTQALPSRREEKEL